MDRPACDVASRIMSQRRLSSLRSRVAACFVGCVLLQACFASPGSRLHGKYCLEGLGSDQSESQMSCLYLQPDGRATVTMFGVSSDARWEFLEQNRIHFVAQSTGSGLILDVSSDQSVLVGLHGLVRYVRMQPGQPMAEPLPADNQSLPRPPQEPALSPASGTPAATPVIAVVACLALVSILSGFILLIRQQGEEDC